MTEKHRLDPDVTIEEGLKPLEVTVKKDKETPYDGEDSYQYEDLNPDDEQLEEDFLGT